MWHAWTERAPYVDGIGPCHLLDTLIHLIFKQHGACTCIVEVTRL